MTWFAGAFGSVTFWIPQTECGLSCDGDVVWRTKGFRPSFLFFLCVFSFDSAFGLCSKLTGFMVLIGSKVTGFMFC